MAKKYPRDRFDEIPEDLRRVGAHRAPRKKGRGWIAFLWALLATLILIGIGVAWLFGINNSINFSSVLPWGDARPTPSASTPPPLQPTVDPSLSVTVLNGTTTSGLANRVGDALVNAGWKVDSRANANESTVTKTVVYYADPTLKPAALGLAADVPGSSIKMTQTFVDSGAALTVVLGSDYKG